MKCKCFSILLQTEDMDDGGGRTCIKPFQHVYDDLPSGLWCTRQGMRAEVIWVKGCLD